MNGIESFWALLKRRYTGTYHHMSRKHLQHCIKQFAGGHRVRDFDTLQQIAMLIRRLKTRQSVHGWLKSGKIVGWRGAKRGCLFPAEQFDDRGRPVPGLDRVIGRFGDGYAAWVWLTTELASLDGATPLTLLADGEIERVAKAAEGDRQGDFA